MEVKFKNTATVTLSKEDLKEALENHLCKIATRLFGYKVTDVTEVTKSIQLPGIDPHDCDWHEVFDGVKVTLKKGDDDKEDI
jgi:hypothetical protein